MKRTALGVAFAMVAAVSGGMAFGASIGFNFTQVNSHDTVGNSGTPPHLSVMATNVDDPFAGLYVGSVGEANYANVGSAGTCTNGGLVVVAPAKSSLGADIMYSWGPIESDFLDPGKTHPANASDSAFVRDMYGVAEFDSGGSGGSVTFSFSVIPYGRYDLYVHTLTQAPDPGATAKITVGGNVFNMYGTGWPIDISRQVRITDTVSNGTWMVFTGLFGASQNLVLSDVSHRAIIGAFQFVKGPSFGAMILVR